MKPQERKNHQRRSAILIQKWVRGHIARREQNRYQAVNIKQMRKLRRMMSVAYARMKKKYFKQIVAMLKESGSLHADQNYQLWKKYKTHCAILIQKHFRGHRQRYLLID